MEIILIIVLGIIIGGGLLKLQLFAILAWLMSIMLFCMYYGGGSVWVYLETIEDYPIEDCIKPEKYKFLYRRLMKLSYKNIPKEMYYSETLKVYGFIFYTILGTILYCFDENLATRCGLLYMCFYAGLTLFTACTLIRKSFLARYKRLNKYNLKYLFYSDNQPYPKRIGSCQIVHETKKGFKNFMTVKVIENGVILDNVILQGKKKSKSDDLYSLYEICKVYYIV